MQLVEQKLIISPQTVLARIIRHVGGFITAMSLIAVKQFRTAMFKSSGFFMEKAVMFLLNELHMLPLQKKSSVACEVSSSVCCNEFEYSVPGGQKIILMLRFIA